MVSYIDQLLVKLGPGTPNPGFLSQKIRFNLYGKDHLDGIRISTALFSKEHIDTIPEFKYGKMKGQKAGYVEFNTVLKPCTVHGFEFTQADRGRMINAKLFSAPLDWRSTGNELVADREMILISLLNHLAAITRLRKSLAVSRGRQDTISRVSQNADTNLTDILEYFRAQADLTDTILKQHLAILSVNSFYIDSEMRSDSRILELKAILKEFC